MSSCKKYFLILFLFSIVISKAQSGYTYCDWNKIKLDPQYVPSESDTAIVFASVRNYYSGKAEFFDYDLDTSHTLHYFMVYFIDKKF